MKNVCYVICAYRDYYQLPIAVYDTVSEVARYINCSVGHVYRHLRGAICHIDGYVVECVEL